MHLLGSNRCRTTAYHPSANGLVERFHQQLKASLAAQPDPTRWTEALPLVLLGIRTALKTDLHCTTPEMVYGTTLGLPGEFFAPDPSLNLADPANYVTQLKVVMSKLKSIPVCKQSPRSTYVHDDLDSCTHVYVRQDKVRKPLEKTYNGPFKVLQRSSKHFTLEVKGNRDVVSLDRLKPAHMEPLPTSTEPPPSTTSLPTPQSSPPTNQLPKTTTDSTRRVTRSGRHVRWPKRFV